MNEERYKHYWLVVMDLHNHHVENNLRIVANPTTKKRMEMIMDAYLVRRMEKLEVATVREDLSCVVAPVPEDCFCDCQRKCATKACPCLAKRVKCTIKCHTKKRSFVPCTNKWSIQKLGVKNIFFYYELYAVFWGTSSMIGTPSGQWGPSRLLWFKIIPSYITIYAMLTKGSDPDPHLRVRPLPSPSGPCWPSRLLGFKIIPTRYRYLGQGLTLPSGSKVDPRVWPWPSPKGQW